VAGAAHGRALSGFDRLSAGLLACIVGGYFLIAAVLARSPANADWREPAAGITIFVESNGFHTGLVVPAVAAGIDWRGVVRAEDLPHRNAGRWLAFGWGDRDFYLNTASWSDLDAAVAARAIGGSGRTLVHVAHYDDFLVDDTIRPIRLTPAQYRRLAAHLAQSFAREREVVPGYGPRDVFYAGSGQFSALRSCNVWVGEGLRAAGIRVGRWTPFASSVMRWMPVRTASDR